MNETAGDVCEEMERLMRGKACEEAARLGAAWLAEVRATLGPDHPDNVAPLNRLAFCLMECGRMEEAEACHREVLRMVERDEGRDSPEYGLHLNNLAVLHHECGRDEAAFRLYVEAGRVLARFLPPDSDLFLDVLWNAADPLLPGALPASDAITERRLMAFVAALDLPGGAVEHLCRTVANQAIESRRWDLAQRLYRRIMDFWVRQMGPRHLYVAESLHHLAELNLRLGRAAEALDFAERELEIRRLRPCEDEAAWADCNSLVRRAQKAAARRRSGGARPMPLPDASSPR
jgi:tetratricopeptide (TPR) repeat protein